MRARYTAHTRADMAYIQATHDPASRDDIDLDATARWARRAQWLGLEIREVTDGNADDTVGTVEFVAHFRDRDERRQHHELARFKRGDDGAWLYIDGETPSQETVRHSSARVGRNDPCPCGSGRKAKKCCGTG